jgi:uncharacterized protein (TIGR02217 family)
MTDAPAFIDTRLRDDVAYGFNGGPNWNTLVQPLQSGHNRRKAVWDFPLHQFSADYALLEDGAKDEVLQAFWVCRGAASAFRFRDWNDFRARPGAVDTGAMDLAVPATSSTPIQITKTYGFGPTTYTRVIQLPLDVALYFDNGGGPVLFTGYTLDPLTGIATPTTTWPAGTPSWTGTHDVRVRFSKDFNPFTRGRPKVSTCMVQLEEDPVP